ncbi:MAG: hypothetical protein IJC62_03260, partial [Clostridia bacterium]|nr:hypothetical protein [Clostridia bacterium]
MKKILSLILALLMLASAFAMTACGNESATEALNGSDEPFSEAPTEAPTEEPEVIPETPYPL